MYVVFCGPSGCQWSSVSRTTHYLQVGVTKRQVAPTSKQRPLSPKLKLADHTSIKCAIQTAIIRLLYLSHPLPLQKNIDPSSSQIHNTVHIALLLPLSF